MASGYRALLQSLDETEKDVKRGLGRSVQIRKPKRSCCCCRSNAVMWTCIATFVLTGLVISVGLPILLTVPVESSWHWKHWMARLWSQVGTNSSSSIISQGQHVLASGRDNGTASSAIPSAMPETDAIGNATASATFVRETIAQFRQMMEWTASQYDNTPKVPLIIGLSALLLVILTIVWLVVYRKIRRRQRRRTIGKLVTDLQSGKTLLNSDDSEED
ncbi:uncharacterized protein LOC130689221 [Daphnia carinata]|uniref:uncharacterized protein LOC130689221 n=1 Tax=Daphnia carinata TaxID=120202 RepID=UPI002580EA68|nr:uncharacterized protein LOC130689221 [Daphnia carinata]